MKKTRGYSIFLLIGMVIIACNFLFSREDVIGETDGYEEICLSGVQERDGENGERIFELDLGEKRPWDNCIYFISLHQSVRVYFDGEEIYSVQQEEGDFWSRTTGVHRNYIPITAEMDKITVEFQSIYKMTESLDVPFYLGNGQAMVKKLVRTSFMETTVCYLDIMVGLFLVFYYLIYRKKTSIQRSALYLGIFAALIGVWAFNETNYSALLISRRSAASNTAFILLMNMLPAFVLFTKHYYRPKKAVLADWICGYCYISQLIMLLLYLTGIMDLKESFILVHGVIIAASLFFVYSLFTFVVREGKSVRTLISIATAIILVASALTDMVLYYLSLLQIKYVGRIGLLIYLSVLGYDTISSSIKQIEKGREAQLLEKLANSDILTGLLNRRAYTEWEENEKHESDTAIINLDLNSLKYYNDTFGHNTGDEYINAASKILQEAFGRVGKCYRVGGDEFIVVLEKTNENQVLKCLDNMKKLEEKYNKSSKLIDLQIAYGYAFFNPDVDDSIEKTRNRADESMYREKVRMKKEKETK